MNTISVAAEYNELVNLLGRAVKFELSKMFFVNGFLLMPDHPGTGTDYCIEARDGVNGRKWAITNGERSCFSKSENDFTYEMLPSNRTDEFLKDCRFDTVEECFTVFGEWKKNKIKELEAAGWKYWQ